ncbi:MAG TPA: VCBS repeat-containing protein [Polyangiaceae bacterium]|nr:VCBS repeat-containing protein [Polyangiaceae bacterium]
MALTSVRYLAAAFPALPLVLGCSAPATSTTDPVATAQDADALSGSPKAAVLARAAVGATSPTSVAKVTTSVATASSTSCTRHDNDFVPSTFIGTAEPSPVSVYAYNGLGARGQTLAQQFVTALANSTIYDDMRNLFGTQGAAVQVFIVPLNGATDGSAGAMHYACDFDVECGGGSLYLDATFDNHDADPVQLLLALFTAELSESFMGTSDWVCYKSNGEGLSRILAEYEAPLHTFDQLETATMWAHYYSNAFPSFYNYVSQTDSDSNMQAVGNAVVYINWMRSLGYSLKSIFAAGGSTLSANYHTLTGKTTAFADLMAALTNIPIRSDNPFPMNDLMWQNASSGQIGSWQLNKETVAGTQFLSLGCGSGGGCSNSWHPVDTIGDNTILWDNPTSGQVGVWSFNDAGTVTIPPFYNQTCDAGSGCSSQWKPIGRVWSIPTCTTELVGQPCPSAEGLAWYNASTGQVEIWHMQGSTFLSSSFVSQTCAGSCAQAWKPMLTADFDNDGNSDILWYNAGTGQLGYWRLDDSGTVLGVQYLSATCSQASGCASAWRLVGAADANGDGNVDLLWHNSSSGALENWMLDGNGNVLSTPTLSSTCGASDGCSASWKALGYVQYP